MNISPFTTDDKHQSEVGQANKLFSPRAWGVRAQKGDLDDVVFSWMSHCLKADCFSPSKMMRGRQGQDRQLRIPIKYAG